MATIRIATFKINGMRPRVAPLLEWLHGQAPDVVWLQELKAPDDAFQTGQIRDAGDGDVWHGQRDWNGGGLFLRVAVTLPNHG